jgi:hypothetical protein
MNDLIQVRPNINKPTKTMVNINININISNYKSLNKTNFSLVQLKTMAKTHHLKVGGNKADLSHRIFSYFCVIKIQSIVRRYFVFKYKRLQGPAIMNRALCTNTDDFITMDPIKDIPFNQFISYKDEDGFIYGFDIISLNTLILKVKGIEIVRNPYNRNILPTTVIKSIKSLKRLSKILHIHINLHYVNDIASISIEKAIELRTLTLFQTINYLGNYTDHQWFLSLSKKSLIFYIMELNDIWNYRSQITHEIKCEIFPPNGNPFRHLDIHYLHNELDINKIRQSILSILENFVNYGINKDSQLLGAYYVLGSLTIVNESAANALPWLFQSFEYF